MLHHSRPPRRIRLDRGNLRDVVIVVSVVSVFFFPLSTGLLTAGLVLLAVGCGLHVLVKGQLIRNATLCTEGAYAIVRHPYYLANYLIDTSFLLLSGNVYLAVLYPFLFYLAYGSTLREEEAVLASRHGERFADYRDAVPQLFPDAISLVRWKTLTNSFSWRRVTVNEFKRMARFGFVATLLVLLRHAHEAGWSGLRLSEWREDYVGQILLAIGLVLLLATVLLPRRRSTAAEEHGD